MKKVLAIVLMMALMAVLACSAFASAEPPAAPAAAGNAGGTFQVTFKEPTATENGWIFEIDSATGNVVNVIYLEPLGGAAQSDSFGAWKTYLIAYAVAGAPNEEEGQTVAGLIDAAATVEEVEAIPQLTVLFENVSMLGYDAWIAAGMPGAATDGMTSEAAQQAASGEAASEEPAASGEPASEEPAAPAASGEPAAAPAAPAASDEAAASEEAPAEEAAPANPNYDPFAHNWASIELILTIVIIVVGAVLMLSFGKKKID